MLVTAHTTSAKVTSFHWNLSTTISPFFCSQFRYLVSLVKPTTLLFIPIRSTSFDSSSITFNHYDLLCVSETSSSSEIKSAYKRLALKFHPDRNRALPDATENFLKVSQAYRILIDPAERAEYDAKLKAATKRGYIAKHDEEKYQDKRNSVNFTQEMTATEAARMFAEAFQDATVRQTVRDYEHGGFTSYVVGGDRGDQRENSYNEQVKGFTCDTVFRPGFRIIREQETTDFHGNRSIKRTIVDPNGNLYDFYDQSSSDPNASMNLTSEEINERYFNPITRRFEFSATVSQGKFDLELDDAMQAIKMRGPFVFKRIFYLSGVSILIYAMILVDLLPNPFLKKDIQKGKGQQEEHS